MARKVCILTTVHPPFDTRVFHKEAKTLARAGYEVVLIARHARSETVDGVRIIALPEPRGRLSRIFALTLRALRLAVRENADVYHFHDPELIPAGVMLKILMGRRIIYDVHEDYAKQLLSKPYIPLALRCPVAALVGAVERLSARFIDCAVTAFDVTENLSRYRIARGVRNYPIVSLFPENGERPGDKKSFDVVYVGALFKTRGITEIVRAMEHVAPERDVRLTLCGTFSPQSYRYEIENLKGFERTRYMGIIPHESVPDVLSKADAGIVCLHPTPNYIEAIPVKMFEYMAAGIPVVASNFPRVREVVESNFCGLCVDPTKPGEIARAIEYLDDNRELSKRMGENGRNAVLKKYRWESERQKLLEIYKEVLGDVL